MQNIFYVSDYRNSGKDDEAISACFADRKNAKEPATVIFSGKDYVISRAILIPSDTTVIIDGCRIKQADFTFDNVFRGDNLLLADDAPYGFPLDIKPIENIKIIGKNGAEIHGAKKHPKLLNYATQKTEEPLGDFWGWRTLTISLSRCSGFEICGFALENARCWALSFDMCTGGHIHDLRLNTNVKNGDGIDFRSGCHNCIVENITGYTSDDTIACTAVTNGKATLPAPSRVYPGEYYLYPMEPTAYLAEKTAYEKDISDITIRNIRTCGKEHCLICLASGGCRVHNIRIENIAEEAPADGAVPFREATVKIYTGYGSGYTKGDLHDITVSDVHGAYADNTFFCNADVENVVLRNITHTHNKAIRMDYPEGITVL